MPDKNIERPVTVEFQYWNEINPYAADIDMTFRARECMGLNELHSFCKKFAIALGYSPKAVEEVFGEDVID